MPSKGPKRNALELKNYLDHGLSFVKKYKDEAFAQDVQVLKDEPSWKLLWAKLLRQGAAVVDVASSHESLNTGDLKALSSHLG